MQPYCATDTANGSVSHKLCSTAAHVTDALAVTRRAVESCSCAAHSDHVAKCSSHEHKSAGQDPTGPTWADNLVRPCLAHMICRAVVHPSTRCLPLATPPGYSLHHRLLWSVLGPQSGHTHGTSPPATGLKSAGRERRGRGGWGMTTKVSAMTCHHPASHGRHCDAHRRAVGFSNAWQEPTAHPCQGDILWLLCWQDTPALYHPQDC
jgi:hypothetical protein